MKTSQEIVIAFIDSGYKHMENIPNNQVFYTDNSCFERQSKSPW